MATDCKILEFRQIEFENAMYNLRKAAAKMSKALHLLADYSVKLEHGQDVTDRRKVQAAAEQATMRLFGVGKSSAAQSHLRDIMAAYDAMIDGLDIRVKPDDFTFDGDEVSIASGTEQKLRSKYTVIASAQQAKLLGKLQKLADEINAIDASIHLSNYTCLGVNGFGSLIQMQQGKAVVNGHCLQYIRKIV